MKLKGLAIGLVTPFLWSYQSGHFRSSLIRKAVDSEGKPIAWYTYPAVDFLSKRDFSGKRILEFGAGHSTLWWAKRAESVLSFDGNQPWIDYLLPRIPENVSLNLMGQDARDLNLEGKFDVIVIDGHGRHACALVSTELLNENGCVIFDNSTGNWGGGDGKTFPVLDHFHSQGYSRVDFHGMAPATPRPDCTSIFWKDSCFLF